VTVKLTLRSDLLKGEVTGQITGVGITLGSGAYSAAVLVRVDTGETIGVDVNPAPGKIPVPFSVAFDPAKIDQNADYVIRAEIVSGDQRWADASGVPVITNGNSISGVSVVVTPVAGVASPAPSPSPVGGSSESSGGSNWLLLLILILLVALGAAVFMWYRSKTAKPLGPDPVKSQAHPMGPADRTATTATVVPAVVPSTEAVPPGSIYGAQAEVGTVEPEPGPSAGSEPDLNAPATDSSAPGDDLA
jgi:Type III secretion system lipoprotein chaperone (YscW)